MSEEDREDFIAMFAPEPSHTLLGFVVMGGVFGEGIDLPGDRLSGAAIVGVGLPQIGLERDSLKDYFDETRGDGFNYAYVYPGMSRVLQAAGRVIRTAEDRGVVLLIDSRYTEERYRTLIPSYWRISNTGLGYIDKQLERFWQTAPSLNQP